MSDFLPPGSNQPTGPPTGPPTAPPTGPPNTAESAPPSTPPGWYTDPWDPQSMRWWDGTAWGAQTTNAQHGAGPGAAPSNGLTDIGQWIGATFNLAVRRAGHVFTIILLAALPGSVALSLLGWAAAGDVQVVKTEAQLIGTSGCVDDPFQEGCWPTWDISGWDSGWIAPLIAALALAIIGYIVAMIAIAHNMHAAAGDSPVGWAQSLVAGIRNFGRWLLFGLVAAVAFIGLLLGTVIAGFASPALGALIGLIAIPLLFFGWVKLSFFTVASAVAPKRTNILSASWRISNGAMWPIIGRLVLLVMVGLMLSFAANLVTSPIASIAGAGLDDAQLTELMDFEGPSGVWAIRDLFGGPAPLILATLLNTLIQGVTLAVSMSGLALLYRQRNGPKNEQIVSDTADPTLAL